MCSDYEEKQTKNRRGIVIILDHLAIFGYVFRWVDDLSNA